MRHVPAYDDANPESAPEGGCARTAIVSGEGRTIALQAGYALAETLDHERQALHASDGGQEEQSQGGSPLGLRQFSVRLLHSETDVTRRTAELLQQGVGRYSSPWGRPPPLTVSIGGCKALLISSAASDDRIQESLELIINDCDCQQADVVVVIMHDPAASWLLQFTVNASESGRWASIKALYSKDGLRRWLQSPSRLPLRSGELIMTRREGKATQCPVWAISPSSEKLIEDIREKISKKMDSAKQLGAFATALFGFAVTGVLRERPQGLLAIAAWLGVATLAMAVTVFFSTLFRYDSLLMPRQLWASTPPRGRHKSRTGVFERPPSSASWILFQNMMLIWLRGFTVACGLVSLGGVLVVVGISNPTGLRGWGLVIIFLASIAALSQRVWQSSRPELGVND